MPSVSAYERVEYSTASRRELPWLTDAKRHSPPSPSTARTSLGGARRGTSCRASGYWTQASSTTLGRRRNNLMDAARRHGARFRFKSDVVAVPKGDGRVTGVELADGTQVRVPVVVNAAGLHSRHRQRDGAEPSTTSPCNTRPLRQEVHEVPAPPGHAPADPGPFVADPRPGHLLQVGTPSGRLLVGGTEPECDPLLVDRRPGRGRRCGPHRRASNEAQLYRAARRLPGPRRCRSSRWASVGIYDVSERLDARPDDRTVRLHGFYGGRSEPAANQFKNAPVVGRVHGSAYLRLCERRTLRRSGPAPADACVYRAGGRPRRELPALCRGPRGRRTRLRSVEHEDAACKALTWRLP